MQQSRPNVTISDYLEKAFVVFGFIVTSGAFIPLIESQGAFTQTAFSPVLFVMLSIIYSVSTILIFLRFDSLYIISRQNFILFAFLAVMIVSALWAVDKESTLLAGLAALLTTMFAFYVITRFKEGEWIILLAISMAIIAFASILMTRWFPYMGMHQTGTWRGVYINRNALATYMAIAIMVFLILSISYRKYKLVSFAMFGICLFIMHKTQSQTSSTAMYIAFGQALAFAILYKLRFSFAWVISIFILVIVPLVGFYMWTNWVDLAAKLGRDSTLSGRLLAWEDVLLFGKLRPWLGFGELTTDAVSPPHNMFLALWLEIGIFGVAFFVLLYCISFIQAINLSRYLTWPGKYFYTSILIFILIRGAMEGLYFTTLLWVLLAMSIIAPRFYYEQKRVQNSTLALSA